LVTVHRDHVNGTIGRLDRDFNVAEVIQRLHTERLYYVENVIHPSIGTLCTSMMGGGILLPPTSTKSLCDPSLSSSVPGSRGVELLSSPEALALLALYFFFGGAGALRRLTVPSEASEACPPEVADEAERGRVCAWIVSDTSISEDVLTGSRDV